MNPSDSPSAGRRQSVRAITRGRLAREERAAKPGKPPKTPEEIPSREELLAAIAEADARLDSKKHKPR